MEMKVVITGLGFSIPKSGLGLNILGGSYIALRISEKTPQVLMGLTDAFSLGSKSETVVVGHIETHWFIIDPVKHNWLTNTNSLMGKKAEIEVVGTLLAKGKVDLKFTVYDKNGNANELISKVDIDSSGFQVANTKVRGVLFELK